MLEHKTVPRVPSFSLCSDPLGLAPCSPTRKSLKPPAPILLPYQGDLSCPGVPSKGEGAAFSIPSTQPPSPLGSPEYLSAWQGCPLGSPQSSSPCSELPQKLLMVPLLPMTALRVVPEEMGTPASP